MPRVSFYNTTGWRHTFEKPSHKKTRAILSGTCDFFFAAPKMLPACLLGPEFEFLQQVFFFGFMRCFQVSDPESFKVFRRDFLQCLMPQYRQRFREYRAVWNPNFLETFTLVDNGLGTVFNWHALSGMKMEQHHQQGKGDSRKGAGTSLVDVHDFHNTITLKSTLGMDLELETAGRIPPTRALRMRGFTVDPQVWKTRYDPTMLGPRHGSRRPDRETQRCAQWNDSRRDQKGLVRLTFRRMPCFCRHHYRGNDPYLRALLLVARSIARREQLANPQAYENDPVNAGGHVWTPGGYSLAREGRYPHSAVCRVAQRMLRALASGQVTLSRGKSAIFKGRSLATGKVRPGYDDHVLTRGTPNVGNPAAVGVKIILVFRGAVRQIHRQFPCESPGVSSWFAGRGYELVDGDAHLIRSPWQGGQHNMRIAGLEKLQENHAVPLAECLEPVFVTHRFATIFPFFIVPCLSLTHDLHVVK